MRAVIQANWECTCPLTVSTVCESDGFMRLPFIYTNKPCSNGLRFAPHRRTYVVSQCDIHRGG